MGKKKVRKLEFDPANLPGELFAYLEQDGDDSYVLAQRDVDGIEAGIIVGVYELVRVAQVTVNTRLEDI